MEPVSGDGSPYQAAVLERLATGSYTYYRLRRAADEGWAVTMGEGPVAKAVQVRVMGQRRDFYSRALDRRFDTLQFAIIAAAP